MYYGLPHERGFAAVFYEALDSDHEFSSFNIPLVLTQEYRDLCVHLFERFVRESRGA